MGNSLRGPPSTKLSRLASILGSLLMRLTKQVGNLLLAIWLILTGAVPLLNLSFSGLGTVMAVLAIAAGILIAISR